MRWVYLAALLTAFSPFVVHGQQPTSITLWCHGTSAASDDTEPDPIMGGGMTVNFEEKTVSFNSFRIPIEKAEGTMVLFHGEQTTRFEGLRLTVDGSIDLVSGEVSLTFEQVRNNMTWKLTCRPLGLF